MNTIPESISRDELIRAMASCEQSGGQSVLDHGLAVAQHFEQLLRHLRGRSPAPDWWRIPGWAYIPDLLINLPSDAVLTEYHAFHDCGKPFCAQVDEQGRRHFPNHAEISERIWLSAGGDPTSARLMGLDMAAHTMLPEDVATFAARPEAAALLLTALAEIHANAEMFGGRNSDQFKAKAKRLASRGRAVCTLLYPTTETRKVA